MAVQAVLKSAGVEQWITDLRPPARLAIEPDGADEQGGHTPIRITAAHVGQGAVSPQRRQRPAGERNRRGGGQS